MKLVEALRVIGLPESFDARTRSGVDMALDRCKSQMVECNGNHEKRVVLSQAKEVFKKVGKTVCACGHRKSKDAPYCPNCRLAGSTSARLDEGARWLPLPQKPNTRSKIQTRMLLLTEAGLCVFIPCRTRYSIVEMGRKMKLQLEIRREGSGFRVWRTDGRSSEELNELINLKMAESETSA